MKQIKVDNITISNELPITLIAGPCQIESEDHALYMAGEIDKIAKRLQINFVYKSSFDKANRSSIYGKRGLGLEGSCEVFKTIKKDIGCAILTDIHQPYQADLIAEYVDIIQIPALLCRQTDLISAAASTGKCVNIKKGQFLSPYEMKNAVEKCGSNRNVMLTERGTSFGYNNLVNDMRSLQIMKNIGYPVVFDATHSVQQPGALHSSSDGQREFIEILSRAAVATGIAAIFIETHQAPDTAPSDGKCMLQLNHLEDLLIRLKAIDFVAKKFSYLQT